MRTSPLPSDHQRLAKNLAGVDLSEANVIWLSGGIDHGEAAPMAESLKSAATAERLSPLSETLPIFPGKTEETASGFRSVWHRPDKASLRSEQITAHAADGTIVSRADIEFSPGSTVSEAVFELPSEFRSRIASLRVDGIRSAGSVMLMDDSWGRPLIGVLSPETDNSSPLLAESFYVRTALGPYADIFTGSLEELLVLAPSIIIMPDTARSESEDLKDFVEAGGLLVRFAGPKLAKRSDPLLPVRLRTGGRELGGALTWEDPQKFDAFPETSPFFGLPVPEDITVKRQVMAEPGAETDARTWARLEDGSPVITSSQLGFGRIVLFHVTAGPDWSNLPASGLYVEFLRRLLALARATPSAEQTGTGDWAAERVLNGFGRLTAPPITTRPITNETIDQTKISQQHPPGLYRQGARRKALNTVDNPEKIKSIGSLSGIETSSYGQTTQRTLGGLLLALALLMLALDAVFALIVSGRLAYLKPRNIKAKAAAGAAALILSAGLILPEAGYAQDSLAPEYALDLHLAYVETGNSRMDIMSEAAMEGLSAALIQRTTIEPSGVRGVDIESDALVFYPFIYWPIARDTPAPTDAAVANLNAYMASGGTLVLDTQDAGDQFSSATHPGLARVTEKLDIPGLTRVPEDHVITKSFYLLQVFPGRWANGAVWVDRDTNGAANDGVSSVIIGSNGWAAGWALNDEGEPLQTLERDIPKQREMSLRFGVNLAMYALAGNYKSDQVHAKALIERLGQTERLPENLGPDDNGDNDGTEE
jgi:hypothetical protein